MKKLAIAAAVAFSVFNFTATEAATVGVDNAEIVEMGPWTKFRDHITGKRQREKERERWERRQERQREHENWERQRERERWERENRDRERWEREQRERERLERERLERERWERKHRHDGRHYPPRRY